MISMKEKEYQELTQYIQRNYGINLSHKRHLIEGRLNNYLMEKGFESFSDYFGYVFRDPSKAEMTNLINRLTTNHTYFMREADHFGYFKDKVLPFLQHSVASRDLRIWSAGCSTGEEPYTLAMILADFFGKDKGIWDTRVLATDISVRALSVAEKGIYAADELQDVPTAWRLSYFQKIDQRTCRITDSLRKEVIFRVFNLMDAMFPFKKKFHTIFCRNVMIYFDYDTKIQLINKFYDFTEPGGYLFMGHAESMSRSDTPYQYVMPAVYRKG